MVFLRNESISKVDSSDSMFSSKKLWVVLKNIQINPYKVILYYIVVYEP